MKKNSLFYNQELNVLSNEYKYAQERFSLIANIIPVIDNKKERNRIIQHISESKNCSKQTIKNVLIRYLIYQNISVLAPQKKKEKDLTQDEKNMRWALNNLVMESDQS